MDKLKIPPFDEGAEYSILGIIVIDNKKFYEIVDLIQTEDFYFRQNQTIFNAIKTMMVTGDPVDFVTLKDSLQKSGKLEDVGGVPYVAKLADDVFSTANIIPYAKIVKEKSLHRELIQYADAVVRDSYEAKKKPDEIIGEAYSKLIDLKTEDKGDIRKISDGSDGVIEKLKNLAEDRQKYGGIYAGFQSLDSRIGGFQDQELIIVAGRPSMGKTSFMSSIMRNITLESRVAKRILFFSLEQSHRAIQARMISSLAHVNSMVFRKGTNKKKDLDLIQGSLKSLNDCDILVNDRALNVYQLCSIATKYKHVKGIDLIFIDYLQRLGLGSRQVSNQNEAITIITKEIKDLAKNLNVPIVMGSQLSRAGEKRSIKMPRLSDLRDSGVVEQEADVVIFLHNDRLIEKEDENIESGSHGVDSAVDMDVIIAKSREGPTGMFSMRFLRQYTLYKDKEAG